MTNFRAVAEEIATPIEDGRLVRAYVTTDADGRWTVCWGLDGARRKVHVGPAFERSDDASQLCKILNERLEQVMA